MSTPEIQACLEILSDVLTPEQLHKIAERLQQVQQWGHGEVRIVFRDGRVFSLYTSLGDNLRKTKPQ